MLELAIDGVKQRFNEHTLSDNGERFRNVPVEQSENYQHILWPHNITQDHMGDTKGRTSMIDYFIMNRQIHKNMMLIHSRPLILEPIRD